MLPRKIDRVVVPAAAALFFCSGASALIYQVLWLRMLGWVLGVTVYAASTVWASFMSGLAIGSFLAGVLSERVRRPLKWFGTAELLIGLAAVSTPVALRAMQRGYVLLYPSLPHSLAAMTFARFAIAFIVLIVPTVLMGATLPLVVKSSDTGEHLGRHLGVLYGTNTAGAIVGTILAGLYLIPTFGIRNTFFVSAGLNLIVGVCALVLGSLASERTRVDRTDTAMEAPAAVAATGDQTATTRRLVLLVFAVSGFVSLAAEVVWFRVLTLFLRPTVYGFAVMLATILLGIAIGTYIVTPLLDRRGRWVAALAGLEIATGLALLFSFSPLAGLPSLWTVLNPVLSRVIPEYLVYPIAGSAIAMFPTMLLMGLAFPIGLRLWAEGRSHGARAPAQRVGVFYALNVGGAIAGSLAAGFVLLPHLGSRTSLIILSALTFGGGIVLLFVSELPPKRRAAIAVAASVLFAATAAMSPDPFDQFIAQRYPRQKVVWREEGVDSTVVVHLARDGERSLTVNGNHQASTGPVMVRGHKRIGHLPMSLHPFARKALVIGLGGGATAGAVSTHEGVDVDVVELAGAVARGARLFGDINANVLARPNVHLRIDDGRNFLMLTQEKYDVVTADVILPIYSGSGNLYSKEYFELIRRVLKPGGMVLQWAAGTDAEYKLIARTFLSVFPETTAWVDGTLLVGMVQRPQFSRADFEWKMQIPGRADALRDFGVTSFDQLLSLFRAGPAEIRAFVGDGPLLTDDRPLVEYFLSLPRDRDVNLSSLHGDVRPYLAPDER